MNHRPTAPSHTLPAACTLAYMFPLIYCLVNLQDAFENPLYFTSTERHWVIARCLALLLVSTGGYVYVWIDWNRRRRKYLEAIASAETEVIAEAGVWPPPPQVETVERREISNERSAAPPVPVVTRLVIGACSTVAALSAVNIIGLVLALRQGFPVPNSAFAPSLLIGFVFTLGAIKTRADWQKKLRDRQRKSE